MQQPCPLPQKVCTAAELGKLVTEKRKLDGLTQADLALYCNVGVRFVGELERGKPTLRLDKVLKVLRGLGIDLIVTGRGGGFLIDLSLKKWVK